MSNQMETHVGYDDRSTGPFEPDTVLPTQFFAKLRQRAVDGERRLMLAVLEDGIHCYRKYVAASDPKTQELFADAEAWIMAEDRTWFFSFDNVCDTLDLNPEYIREGLVRWKARTLAAMDGMTTPTAAPAEPAPEELRKASA